MSEEQKLNVMTVMMTCKECGSAINVYANSDVDHAKCDVCNTVCDVKFTPEHEAGTLKECPCCERKDFYKQKDFNRKLGVILFVIAAILSIFTYGISFIVLYLFDFILFRKLKPIAICYKCTSIFRGVKNIEDIGDFNHEMNDRIVYADHNFEGKQLSH